MVAIQTYTKTKVDELLALKAPLASPALTGNPTAPTPSAADNDTSIATTAFVQGEISGKAPLASPALTGTPTAPTAAQGTNTTQIATTAYVQTEAGLLVPKSVLTTDGDLLTRAGGVVARITRASLAADTAFSSVYQPLDTDLTAFAAKTAPSGAVVGTTDTQTLTNKTLTAPAISSPTGLAKADVGLGSVDNTADTAKPVSTAQQTALDLKANLASPALTGTPTAPTATAATSTTQLATTAFVTTADNLKAPLASPTFTGTPAAPTAAGATSTTQIATTAFVQGELTAKAPLASPTFTGTPAAPTAAQGTNTTQVASTAYVQTEAGLLVTKATLTTDGDVLTRAAGVPARITRANLAADTAFSSAYQGLNSKLTSVGGMTWAADKGFYTTSSSAITTFDLPSFGRTLIANTTAQLARDDLVAYGREMGYAEITSNWTTTNTNNAAPDPITGLSVTVTGTGRPVQIEFFSPWVQNNTAARYASGFLLQDGTKIQFGVIYHALSGSTGHGLMNVTARKVLTDGVSYTFTVGMVVSGGASTMTVVGGAANPSYLSVTER